MDRFENEWKHEINESKKATLLSEDPNVVTSKHTKPTPADVKPKSKTAEPKPKPVYQPKKKEEESKKPAKKSIYNLLSTLKPGEEEGQSDEES
jgi:hypothetical protein